MFPPRSCAIQNSWNCLAHSCLLFYSFITSTVQIRGDKRDAPTHPGIQTEWRSLIFRQIQKWYKLFSLKNNSASTNPCDFRLKRHSCPWNKSKKGDKHRNPSPKQEEPGNPWWNRTLFLRKERREKTSTGPPARTKRNQQIHDETRHLSWERKEERRRETSTGTQPEPGGTSKLVNHDGTEALSWEKKEERRRETSTGTRAGTRRNQQIMMEQNSFPEERKKREEGRQAPEPKKRE